MLYMVIENFKNRDAGPVYRRYYDKGRMLPEGLHYLDSWVEPERGRCFQLMECEDRSLLDAWIARWDDLVEFEIAPVVSSAVAQTIGAGD